MRVTPWEIVQKLRYKDPGSPTEAERDYRQRFLSLYPDQEANVLSFQANPQCKCSGDMVARITKDTEQLRGNAKILFSTVGQVEVVVPRMIAGEVHIIPNDDASYHDFIAQAAAKHWQYRGLSPVATPDGSLKLYFW